MMMVMVMVTMVVMVMVHGRSGVSGRGGKTDAQRGGGQQLLNHC